MKATGRMSLLEATTISPSAKTLLNALITYILMDSLYILKKRLRPYWF